MLRTLQTLVLALVATLATASSATAFAPETALGASHDHPQPRVGPLATRPREAHQQNTRGYGDVASDASLAAEGIGTAANRLAHVFCKAEHALNDFVKASGGQEQAFAAVQKAANEALTTAKLPIGPNGMIPTGNAGPLMDVAGTQIRLTGGRVIYGVVQLASCSRKGLP
jgi:hypothetical protein